MSNRPLEAWDGWDGPAMRRTRSGLVPWILGAAVLWMLCAPLFGGR